MYSDKRQLFLPIGKFNQSLLCKICNNLSIDPVECTSCENLYCSECYQSTKSLHDKCPDQNCTRPFTTKIPHRMIRDQLSKIQFQCINYKEGCKIEMTQENVIKHAAECPYQLITCKCGKANQRRNLEQHKNLCTFHKTQSCLVCKKNLTIEELKNHKCIQELQQMINQFEEKFLDYKEQSNYAILELKNQQNQRINEFITANQQITILKEENKQLKQDLQIQLSKFKENIEKLDKQRKSGMEQQQQQQQQQQQNQLISKGELIESNQSFCEKKHKLNFWKNPCGEEKKKQCSKCQKQNTTCRYFCQQCSIFICFKCYFPELKIEKQPMQTCCPSKHQMNQISDDFRCSSCDKRGDDMIQPIAFQCNQCEFRICLQCIKNKKFQEIN